MTCNKKNIDSIFTIFYGACIMLTFATLIFHLIDGGVYFSDHNWYWKECACTLKGVDATIAIQQGLLFDEIGELPPNSATLPWMKFIGIFLHGSFLTYELSCIYFVLVNVIALGAMILILYKKIMMHTSQRKCAILCSCAMFTSWYLVDWIQQGNNATLVCILTIIAVFIIEQNEMMAGLLLGVAMIKPQIVLPFYVVLLFRKKWRAIFVSGGVVLGSWIIVAIMTRMNPLEQLYNVLFMSFSYDQSFWIYGLLDPLRSVGLSATSVMCMSMIFGIAICITLTYVVEIRLNGLSENFVYMIPSIVSIFWCYKSQCDYNILALIVICGIEYWYTCGEYTMKRLSIIWLVVIILMMKPFSLINAFLDLIGLVERTRMIHGVLYMDLYAKTFVAIGFIIYIIIDYHKKCNQRKVSV